MKREKKGSKGPAKLVAARAEGDPYVGPESCHLSMATMSKGLGGGANGNITFCLHWR